MHEVEFRVLGPFEVWVEGRALELKRRKQRALLALLLLHAGEVVSTDRLIEDLWAGTPPKSAVGSLQNLISDLRKALGRDLVRTRQPGYLLDVERERVDLHRFERFLAQATEGGDAERRSELLREALGLWRGPPLADLAFEPFAQVEISRLEELRTAAREELIGAELDLGHHAQLVGELEALVTEHPLRERLRGQLMLALYRSGRQAEALEAYRQARETLVEELGIEPSTELQQLEHAILRHDQELDFSTQVPESAPEPERRKTVTVLFTDVVDSTALGAALDPEVMRAVMSRYFDLVRMIVERHSGTVEKFIGDAAMAAFGIPQQHEDDAMRAVRAAAELREAMTGLNTDLEREHGVGIQIRTAINTGEVVAGDSASGQPFATGNAINVAMKLHEAALPAEILLGPRTHSLVQAATATEQVEPVDLGAALGRITAHRLVFVSDAAGLRAPGRASFVGRDDELARLQSAFEQVRAESRSRVLTILGEAGVGKSRLVGELASLLREEARFLVGRCLSYGEGATYLPLAEIVRQVAPKRPQSAIASLLAGDDDADLIATRLAELTGDGDGGGSSGEVFWAARRLFEALARERPLVLVLEDVHWAEPTLLDLVVYLSEWSVDSPLLVLCLARPEFREGRPGLGTDADVLRLEPLAEAAVTALVEELGGLGLDPATRKRVGAVAEGNPLFVEQLLAFLDEAGPDALELVPPTVEALLASRIDGLEAEDRALLERAAVIGREFSRAGVLHLTPPEELPAADGRLRSLDRRGLIAPLRDSEDGFRFHHVLIRDVTYAGITKETRGALHERIAAWLERREQHADEIIGYHLEQAHLYRWELRAGDPELPALAERAGGRLATAGIRAWKRADTPAAINLLTRATSLLPVGEPSRAELLCELGIAQFYAGEIETAADTLREAIETASGPVELRARIELEYSRLFSDPESRSAELLELAVDAIPLFEEVEDDRALGRTWRHVGYVRGGLQSRHQEAQSASEQALVYYLRSGWSPSGCLVGLAASLYYGPVRVPDAVARCNELLEGTSERVAKAHVLVFLGGLVALDGRIDDGRNLVEEASAIYAELGEAYARANNGGRILGDIELLAGDYLAAETALREACALFEQAHDQAALSSVSSTLAQALYARGRILEAKEVADTARDSAPRDDVPARIAWRAVSAKLLAREGALHDAEALVREAVALSESTDSPCQRANVLMDLAEVKRLAEDMDEAATAVGRALRLFEQKGDVISAERARGLLDEHAIA